MTSSGEWILVAGDTHGNLDWITTLAKLASRFGCGRLVILGDFGFWVDGRRLAKTGERTLNTGWLNAVQARLSRFDVHATVIDGNHDNHPLARAAFPADPVSGIRTIGPNLDWADRGSGWVWSGVRFGALGGAVSIDRAGRVEGVSWWATEAITYFEADRLASRGRLDVLLTHESPAHARTPMARFASEASDHAEGCRRMIQGAVETSAPRLLLHGHHHVRYSDRISGPGFSTVVEGFASDDQGDGRAWGILELPSLKVIDGRRAIAEMQRSGSGRCRR